MIVREADRPLQLWQKLNLAFISEKGNAYVDENTGISVQSFHNTFTVLNWDPEEDRQPLGRLMRRMGYSDGGTKITQLTSKYIDWDQFEGLKEALKEYREKERFTLGMTFRNAAARSGGCLTGLQIVKYQKQEEAIIYAKIVEIPKKFAADLYFFNSILAALAFRGPVRIITTCIFFWKVTAPLLIPLVGLDRFEHPNFRRHVIRKIREREYLASDEYKYRNEARTWIYLKPIIDQMIQEGRINEKDLEG